MPLCSPFCQTAPSQISSSHKRRMFRSRASFRHALARDPSLAPAALNLGKALHFRIVAERDTPGKNSQAKVVVRELREAVHWFDRAVRPIRLSATAAGS